MSKDLVFSQARRFLHSLQHHPSYSGSFAHAFYMSMKVQSVQLGEGYPGSVFFSCIVPEFTYNAQNGAGGGAVLTYIDLSTTAALFAFDEQRRAQVSTKINCDYMNSTRIGSEVLIEARVNKIDKKFAFTECKITYPDTKMLICMGNHIKSFVKDEYHLFSDEEVSKMLIDK